MAKFFYSIFSICTITICLSSCGQKGPLYLPETGKESQQINHRTN